MIPDETLSLARDVARVLRERNNPPLLIGALALAAHSYLRTTTDVDFAVAVEPADLQELARALEAIADNVVLSPPSADDPLGGVITVERRESLPVQVVNFDNSPGGGFPRLVRGATLDPDVLTEADLGAPVVSLVDLILFKLYAGGPKSELDILELLARKPVDWRLLREKARDYRLHRELEGVLQRAGVEP